MRAPVTAGRQTREKAYLTEAGQREVDELDVVRSGPAGIATGDRAVGDLNDTASCATVASHSLGRKLLGLRSRSYARFTSLALGRHFCFVFVC